MTGIDIWWQGGVIYQIYPRSFRDSSGNGVGDLNGITERLDYIADLGVDAIWISPFFKSPMKDFGYDISDYCDVDTIFGTLSDFDDLLERAHALGLKVMIDQVWSHTSDQHAWFEESRESQTNPKSNWYTWADAKPDGSPPNNWLSVFGGPAWTWDTRREQYYLHNFLKSQPDLNFHNPNVRAAVLGIAKFWLDRGVDGFRLDVCNFYFQDPQLRNNPVRDDGRRGANPHDWQSHKYCRNQPENLSFLAELRALSDAYEDRCLMGEIGDIDGLPIMIEYTAGSARLHTAYSFDFLGRNHSTGHLESILTAWQSAGDGWPTWTVGNHDFPRVATRWGGDHPSPEQLQLFAAFQLSLKGTICLYQGEELGLEQAVLEFHQLQDPEGIAFWPAKPGRDGCRTPMPWDESLPHAGFSDATDTWLPVYAPHFGKAAAQQSRDPNALLAFYKRLIAVRSSQPALRLGELALLPAEKSVLRFDRSFAGETIRCIFNFSAAPVKLANEEIVGDILLETGLNENSAAPEIAPWGFALMYRNDDK